MTNPCANLFPEMEFNGSGAIDVTAQGVGSCEDPLIVNHDLLISDDPGNVIEERVDGLYGAPEILCYKSSFKFSENLSISNWNDCNAWETIPAGSTVAFLPPYLHKPSSGSSFVQVAIYEPNGNVVAVCTIANGQTTGSWNTNTFSAGISDRRIAAVVVSVGSSFPGCGLTIPFQVCEPYSAYADPDSLLTPSQICSIISANCNASITEITPGVYRHTANDGTVTDMPITGFGPGDVSSTPNNAIVYNNGAYAPKVEVYNYASTTPGQATTTISGPTLDALSNGGIYTQGITNYVNITNPSSTRSMRLFFKEIQNDQLRADLITPDYVNGPTGGSAASEPISHVWETEFSVNGGAWNRRRYRSFSGVGTYISGGNIVIDWKRVDQFYALSFLSAPVTLAPGANLRIDVRAKFTKLSGDGHPNMDWQVGLGPGNIIYGFPGLTAMGIII